MATNEDLLEIIKEQQKQIDFLINEFQNMKQKPLLEETHFMNISKLILEKTKDSFKMPNISYKNPDINYEKGIKYIIERKQNYIITDIDNIQVDKNINFIDAAIYYEIKFYVECNLPNIPCIPIYDEENFKKPPSKRNIFRINDINLHFMPKIFYEIKSDDGKIDIIQERFNLF
jgi:hypothetical protein